MEILELGCSGIDFSIERIKINLNVISCHDVFRKLEQPETTFEYDQRTVIKYFPSALYTVDTYLNMLQLSFKPGLS